MLVASNGIHHGLLQDLNPRDRLALIGGCRDYVIAELAAAWVYGALRKPPNSVAVYRPRGSNTRVRLGALQQRIARPLQRGDIRTYDSMRITSRERTAADLLTLTGAALPGGATLGGQDERAVLVAARLLRSHAAGQAVAAWAVAEGGR